MVVFIDVFMKLDRVSMCQSGYKRIVDCSPCVDARESFFWRNDSGNPLTFEFQNDILPTVLFVKC